MPAHDDIPETFSEYNQVAAQVLLTKYTMQNHESVVNAKNTFEELFKLDAIPVVNENDTVSTYEIEFGDNDKLSALVSALIGADLLILLSDIDGLYTDDPNVNPDAEFIELVPHITDELRAMGKGSASAVGTGGMAAKIDAAIIATEAGADMIIANSKEVDIISSILMVIISERCFLPIKPIILTSPIIYRKEEEIWTDLINITIIWTLRNLFQKEALV